MCTQSQADRNFDSVPAIPSKEDFVCLRQDKSKLPRSLQFVLPQRFVTSSLIQTLSEIDRLLPGTELEIPLPLPVKLFLSGLA